jgi:hypothetical protein
MIKYALKCEAGHDFEGWFSSSDGFDEQAAQGLVECPLCGTSSVAKAIMAPQVRTSEKAEETRKAVAEAMFKLRKHVESTHDYVGSGFATEARDMHEGLTPERPIYGEATPDEVKALVEDGVPVAALPVFTPPKGEGPGRLPGGAKKASAGVEKKLN